MAVVCAYRSRSWAKTTIAPSHNGFPSESSRPTPNSTNEPSKTTITRAKKRE
jgi:hypothetical protein